MHRRSSISGSCTSWARSVPNQSDALAVEWYLSRRQGYAHAQFNLGFMYEQGRGGLPQSDVLAGVVPQGRRPRRCRRAQSNIGFVYEHGRGGLPQSDALAVEWYRKAADQDMQRRSTISESCTIMARGGCLRVIPWRWSGAASRRPKCTRAVQSRGHVRAWQGGLPQSDVLAVEWYRKAADQGDAMRSPISGHVRAWQGWVASE